MGKNSTMHIWRYVMIVFVVLAGLGGCQTTAPVPPTTTADEFMPLAMNARRLEIVDNWQMPVEPPYIGYRAQTSPSNLLARWASQVLQPAGGSGELVFDISRASSSASWNLSGSGHFDVNRKSFSILTSPITLMFCVWFLLTLFAARSLADDNEDML